MNLEVKIEENDPVRKVIKICEQLDYTELWKTYLRTWRKFNPETMFMILVYAYVCGVYSGREIEERCRTDIRFMWILDGSEVPDNATISRFQDDRLIYAIEDLFYQFVEKLHEMDEVLYTDKINGEPGWTMVGIHSIAQRYDVGKEFPELIVANYDFFEREAAKPRQLTFFSPMIEDYEKVLKESIIHCKVK